MTTQDDIQQFMAKVKQMEKGEKLDLSSDEDLSMGVMNLISMEEHLFFTYNKTKNDKYLDLLNEIREMRKTLLKKLIKDYEGEVWCISKHLLAASMRLMEVGTKALTKGEKEEAGDLFQKSYQLYSLFWGLNLGLINADDINKDKPTLITDYNNKNSIHTKKPSNVMEKLGMVVQKIVNCCKE